MKITDEEAKCYLERYPDLTLAFGTDVHKAKNHWRNHGFGEGRTKACEKDLSAEEIECYISRYADVAELSN